MTNDLSNLNPTEAFAVPGKKHLIDLVHPVTGRSAVYGQTLEEIQERYPGAVKVNMAEWIKNKGEEDNQPVVWQESTEEKFDEMMNVLPPIGLRPGGFLVGEPADHNSGTGHPRYECHLWRHGKFLVSSRPITVKEFRALFI